MPCLRMLAARALQLLLLLPRVMASSGEIDRVAGSMQSESPSVSRQPFSPLTPNGLFAEGALHVAQR